MVVAMTTIVTKRDGDIVMLLQSIDTAEAQSTEVAVESLVVEEEVCFEVD